MADQMTDKEKVLAKLNAKQYYESELGITLNQTEPGMPYFSKVRCPFHRDKTPSLRISADGHFKCFSTACDVSGDIFDFCMLRKGCDFYTALSTFAEFVGVTLQAKTKKKKEKPGKIVENYVYTNEAGEDLYQVVRFEPKSFAQCRWDKETEAWIWNMKGVSYVPYKLHLFSKSDIIYICEGEKGADALNKFGIVATTHAGGAGTWQPGLNAYFDGKDVVLLPDKDEPGEKHVATLGTNLKSIAKSIRVLRLPGLPPGGDVYDWVKAGGTQRKLEELVLSEAEGFRDYIEELNDIHAVDHTSKVATIYFKDYDAKTGETLERSMDLKSFKLLYAARTQPNPNYTKGQPKEISIAELWLKHPDRRIFLRSKFRPGLEVAKTTRNLWQGFAVEPEQGDWSLLRNHVLENICNGNKVHFNFIMAWMARIVQDPACVKGKPGTAIVLDGGQGTGKGCFLSHTCQLFGLHGKHINSSDIFTQKFNGMFEDAVFVFVDEGSWIGNKKAEGCFKGFITEKTLVIERKGKETYSADNFANFVLASNEDRYIPASYDDRRFFVLKVSDRYAKDREFFGPIYKQMENGGNAAMLYDWSKLDISGIDLSACPRTEAHTSQVIAGLQIIDQYWIETVERGKPIRNKPDIGWEAEISSVQIMDDFTDWSRRRGLLVKDNFRSVAWRIRKLCPDITSRKSDGKYFYTYPPEERCFYFIDIMLNIGLYPSKNEGLDGDLGI